MPPLPAVPGVVKINLFWSQSGDANVLTRLHAKYTGTAPSNAVCATIAQDIYGFITGAWLPQMNTFTAIEGVQVQDLSSSMAGVGEYLHHTAGTNGSGASPAGSCVLSNGKIQRRYRGGKPRAYLPLGTVDGITDENDWSAAKVNATNTLMNALATDIAGVTESGTSLGVMCAVSYYQGFTPFLEPSGRYRNIPKLRVGPPEVDEITQWVARARIASQRRRNLMRS